MQNQTPPDLSPDFEGQQFADRPYEYYQTIRRDSPVFRSVEGIFYTTRHADCLKILGSDEFRRSSASGVPFASMTAGMSPVEVMLADWLVLQDPPRHTLIREQLIRQIFTEPVAILTDRIDGICHELIGALVGRGDDNRIDFISEIAYPLPVMVICELLGIPASDKLLFMQWSADLTRALNNGDPTDLDLARPTVHDAVVYFRDMLRQKRKNPGHDTISRLLGPSADHQILTDEVIIHNLIFLIWAGHETTKSLLANGLLSLLQNREQLEYVSSNLGILDLAIEEMLRFESPIQKISRWTTREQKLGEYRIPADSQVVCLLGAANRDPLVFPNPDNFEPSRSPNNHIAFGKGAHHCPGSKLSRLEAKVFFRNLAGIIRGMEAVEYTWSTYSAFRRLDQLYLTTG